MVDRLIYRDMIWTVHSNMRGEMQTAFTNVLDPRLVNILHQQLRPLQSTLEESDRMRSRDLGTVISRIKEQRMNLRPLETQLNTCEQVSLKQYEDIIAKMKEQDLNLATAVEIIKQHVTNFTRVMDMKSGSGLDRNWNDGNTDLSDSLATLELANFKKPAFKESLQEM